MSEDYPNSPYRVLVSLVEAFQKGERDRDSFLSGLTIVDEHLERWYATVDQMTAPEGYEEGFELQEASREGLRLFADSVSELREFAESGQQESLDRALELARQGHELLAELLNLTARNMEQLEAEM